MVGEAESYPIAREIKSNLNGGRFFYHRAIHRQFSTSADFELGTRSRNFRKVFGEKFLFGFQKVCRVFERGSIHSDLNVMKLK